MHYKLLDKYSGIVGAVLIFLGLTRLINKTVQSGGEQEKIIWLLFIGFSLCWLKFNLFFVDKEYEVKRSLEEEKRSRKEEAGSEFDNIKNEIGRESKENISNLKNEINDVLSEMKKKMEELKSESFTNRQRIVDLENGVREYDGE